MSGCYDTLQMWECAHYILLYQQGYALSCSFVIYETARPSAIGWCNPAVSLQSAFSKCMSHKTDVCCEKNNATAIMLRFSAL
jgi:hypothetical protein